MGMVTALGIMWVFTELMYRRKRNIEESIKCRVAKVLKHIAVGQQMPENTVLHEHRGIGRIGARRHGRRIGNRKRGHPVGFRHGTQRTPAQRLRDQYADRHPFVGGRQRAGRGGTPAAEPMMSRLPPTPAQ